MKSKTLSFVVNLIILIFVTTVTSVSAEDTPGKASKKTPQLSSPVGPSFFSPSVRNILAQETPDIPQIDSELGKVLDVSAEDTETKGAVDQIKGTFAETIFGTILSKNSAPSRITTLKRTMQRIKALLHGRTFQIVISATVYKKDKVRGFSVRLRDQKTSLLCDVYLVKDSSGWKYDDIQRLKEIKNQDNNRYDIEEQTMIESEGRVPYGH